MSKWLLVPIMCAAATAMPGAVVSFTDGFEGASIDPFWQVTQDYGTVSTSADLAFSGTQSAKFASISGGQRGMRLTHDFGEAMYGIVSVRFYDYAPGQETLYEFLRLYTVNAFGENFVGAADYDAFCYQAGSVPSGPNQSCGIYPGTYTTNTARTAGWRLFEIDASSTAISISIDGSQVFTQAGDFPFRYVDLAVSGPFWRPNTLVYWDDFQVNAESAAIPEPSAAVLVGCGLLILGLRRPNEGRKGCRRG